MNIQNPTLVHPATRISEVPQVSVETRLRAASEPVARERFSNPDVNGTDWRSYGTVLEYAANPQHGRYSKVDSKSWVDGATTAVFFLTTGISQDEIRADVEAVRVRVFGTEL